MYAVNSFVHDKIKRKNYRKIIKNVFSRCGIPVIIMGETGCGKTRLIKFMCDLQIPAGADVQNMVLMKVTKFDLKLGNGHVAVIIPYYLGMFSNFRCMVGLQKKILTRK